MLRFTTPLMAGFALLAPPGAAGAAQVPLADHVQYAVGGLPNGLAAADLDGDGDVDIACANILSQDISILFNHGDGTFAAQVRYPTGGQPRTIAVGDPDGDGDPDLVVGMQSGASLLALLLNGGTGAFSSPIPIGPAPGLPDDIVIGHFDTDAKLDIAVVHGGEGLVVVFPGQTGTAFRNPKEYAIPSNPINGGLAAGDVDGDGDVDLVTTFIYAQGAPRVLLNSGNGAFSLAPAFHGDNNATPAVAVGDMDGVNGPDILDVSNGVRVYLNNGSGSFGGGLSYDAGVLLTSVTRMTLVDLNVDGAPDVVVTGSSASQVGVLVNDGAGAFGPPAAHATGPFASRVIGADLNGDGFPDLIASNRDGASVSVLINQGSATAVGRLPAPSAGFGLGAGFPNPTSSSVTALFRLPHGAHAELTVYDVTGRRVRSLAGAWMPAGTHHATWDGRTESGRPAASGVYVLRMKAERFRATRRIVLVR